MDWEMGEKAFIKFFAYVLKSRRLDELYLTRSHLQILETVENLGLGAFLPAR